MRGGRERTNERAKIRRRRRAIVALRRSHVPHSYRIISHRIVLLSYSSSSCCLRAWRRSHHSLRSADTIEGRHDEIDRSTPTNYKHRVNRQSMRIDANRYEWIRRIDTNLLGARYSNDDDGSRIDRSFVHTITASPCPPYRLSSASSLVHHRGRCRLRPLCPHGCSSRASARCHPRSVVGTIG